ncbi:glycosyltransferase family 4 protein [Ancylobacter polymorphus]|uniref:Glycosyltransferase family 4 protein n=1 Tax=Ancylobacter polymorphus TaxID=223390 RepID=A0A9E6ZYP1_9HYPH|nr:glycosyltransferase family 4 protein [Ancylobacter polymorphus]UOK72811.1 glycosyltransferase family 4 protein [Ancylobacter polymorphus]
MKIALLTKYGDLAASTRQRFHQYSSFLESDGFELIHRPLLDDDYLRHLYEGRRRDNIHIFARYFDRLMWLLSRPDTDLIWLHCELFPFLPGVVERLAGYPGKPIIFDYDDAIFHNYDQHRSGIVRRFLGQKIQKTIGGAKLVIAGNAYLANYARPFCPRVEIVPTIVDLTAYTQSLKTVSKSAPKIGWIGTPSTWTEYMAPMMPLLTQAAQSAGARIIAVGAGRAAAAHPLLDNLTWTEESEVTRIHEMDIGVMPLDDSPWARGKCGYKLIQYMACGLPVVASPVGVNAEIVEHGVNGFLATTHQEWNAALTTLLRDPDLRRRMGAAGRRKVEEAYSLQVWGPRLAALLAGVAGRVV